MTSSRQMVERRRHKRFRAPKGLFALLRPGYTKVGSVVDMGMSGLAFRYVARGESLNGSHVEIFMIGDGFYPGKVPIKIISDVEVVAGTPSSRFTMRQCAVRFSELTPQQKAEIERFIESLSVGEA
ncbi:MAG: PilZ domain-containing protein [Desulfobacterales bacterium]|nr:MAG: PilZ domain-containing protein [Desulfobacterales bacterium]